MRLRRLVDDGAVFYLNGTEIFRTTNMPPGVIEYSTLAGHVPDAACMATGLLLPPNSLIQGTNILAVEVHQARETQPQLTDVVFDAELALEFRRAPIIPELRVAHNAAEAVLTWEGTGWSLQTADDVSGSWSRLSAPGNRHVSPLNTPGEWRFFRLANP